MRNAFQFEQELQQLIENSGLTISECYYVVENAALHLKLLYQEWLSQEEDDTAN